MSDTQSSDGSPPPSPKKSKQRPSRATSKARGKQEGTRHTSAQLRAADSKKRPETSSEREDSADNNLNFSSTPKQPSPGENVPPPTRDLSPTGSGSPSHDAGTPSLDLEQKTPQPRSRSPSPQRSLQTHFALLDNNQETEKSLLSSQDTGETIPKTQMGHTSTPLNPDTPPMSGNHGARGGQTSPHSPPPLPKHQETQTTPTRGVVHENIGEALNRPDTAFINALLTAQREGLTEATSTRLLEAFQTTKAMLISLSIRVAELEGKTQQSPPALAPQNQTPPPQAPRHGQTPRLQAENTENRGRTSNMPPLPPREKPPSLQQNNRGNFQTNSSHPPPTSNLPSQTAPPNLWAEPQSSLPRQGAAARPQPQPPKHAPPPATFSQTLRQAPPAQRPTTTTKPVQQTRTALVIRANLGSRLNTSEIAKFVQTHFRADQLGLRDPELKVTNNSVVVLSSSEDGITRLHQAITQHPQALELETHIPAPRKPTFRIVGVDAELHASQIPRLILTQNPHLNAQPQDITLSSDYTSEKGTRTVTITTTVPLYQQLRRLTHLKLSWVSCALYLHINVPTCNKCATLGHVEKHCRRLLDRCGYCCGAHTLDRCPHKDTAEPPECASCWDAGLPTPATHPVYSPLCPIRRQWLTREEARWK